MTIPETRTSSDDLSHGHERGASSAFDPVLRHPSSGISVLIVGSGVGGLTAALECWRKGHEVRIVERASEASMAGDFLTIGPSATQFFRNWPQAAKENEEIAYDPWISYHKHTGERILGPKPLFTDDSKPGEGANIPDRIYRHHRPKFHQLLLAQAHKIGIEVAYGQRAVEYFEDASARKGGVILQGGSKLEADLVVAADGVGTKSFMLTMGEKVDAKGSGYAIYRTAYPVELAIADPHVAERFKLLEDGRSVVEMWMGPDVHLAVWRSKDIMSWSLTHKDVGSAAESWGQTVEIEDVLKFTAQIPDFPEIMNRVIKTTPKGGIIDWKLVWRDPQSTWSSPEGRVIQLGDSAHTFLPSSGNGGTQAIEDAISLATCLQIAGKNNIGWAVKVHSKLRFERVCCCQLLGFVNQSTRHRTDWKAAATKPSIVQASYGKWLWQHDAEDYAYENYGKALRHLLTDEPFQNQNVPPGYTYKPWSINELLSTEGEPKDLEVDGDWS